MTLTVTTPAPAAAVLDLYSAAVVMKPLHAKAAILQCARSQSFLFEAAGVPIAATLLYPLDAERPGERLVELAFVCLPELRQHLVSLIRLAHLTRGTLAQNGPVRVRAHVRHDHRPGHRLAALCGMTLVGRVGAFDRYEFEGQPHDQLCQRGKIAFLGA
ncbi:hypothetical protein [Bradyrhizobium elkanii]|uniref:Uncharacterized protein n=1 Tax=Bradyrhizobium elkanii TaxID=29448 RepID=A0A8I1YD83_BRAEL|nr:hypothetical protein [Bradyrhizobium elkanii]MBP1296625.1 hypothetical protein [Bradyrhizobium elkanii]